MQPKAARLYNRLRPFDTIAGQTRKSAEIFWEGSYYRYVTDQPVDEAGWLADLNKESPLELVLRGHLWIESQLIELLSIVVPFPEAVDFSRFSFPQKVALAAAHGFIAPDETAAYLKLNSLRNKVAHRLNAALSEQDATDLINCLSTHLRHASMVDEPKVVGEPWPNKLRHIIASLRIRLQVQQGRYIESVEKGKHVAIEVREMTRTLRAEREAREASGPARLTNPSKR